MIKMAVSYSVLLVLLFCNPGGEVMAQGEKLYVLAPSGLNLRQSSDPSSAKIASLPYGTKVTLISPATGASMLIDNLSGGMAKVDAGVNTGYIFDGYLSHFPAPQSDMSPEKYVELARGEGKEVHFESHNYDYDGYFKQEDGVTLLQSDWQEAFLIAKALGNIPPKLHFPPASKQKKQEFVNPDKTDMAWMDQLSVERDDTGNITLISWYHRGEGGGRYVNISREPNSNGLLIMLGGIAD